MKNFDLKQLFAILYPKHVFATFGTFVFGLLALLSYYQFDDYFKAIPVGSVLNHPLIVFGNFRAALHSAAFDPSKDFPHAYGWYFFWILLPIFIGFVLRFFWKKFLSQVRLVNLVAYFFWVLLITCLFIIRLAGKTDSEGLSFFFYTVGYLALPLVLGIVSAGFGRRILQWLRIEKILNPSMLLPVSLIGGWSAFAILFVLVGFLGFYNLWFFYGLLIVMAALSYVQILEILIDAWNLSFWKEDSAVTPGMSNLSWILNALMLGLLSMMLSVNFANIMRPFPIGWDDLGAYMNFPKLMAYTQSTAHQGMVLWQSFTGIGFLHQSATQAFFLNSFWGIIAIIAIWMGISYFLPKTQRLFSLPLLGITIFVSLPMVVFQQAMDMKVDEGLLAVSIVSFILLFEAFKQKNRYRILLLAIAGFLAGIAFGIKFTSLMLILSAISVIWYFYASLAGFLGFLAIFVGVFTQFRLWDFLNVNYPRDNPHALTYFSIWTIVVGIVLLLFGIWEERNSRWILVLRKNGTLLARDTLLFCAGILLALSPWLVKNTVEILTSSTPKITINGLLNGDVRPFVPDLTKIHTQREIDDANKALQANTIDDKWQAKNEDLSRYFGYEPGITNYLRMPLYLTIQKNQNGQFTDIGYLFLALIPGALLFILKKRSSIFLYAFYLVGIFYLFFAPDAHIFGTTVGALIGSIDLPAGYSIIVLVSIIPLAILHWDGMRKLSDIPEEKETSIAEMLTPDNSEEALGFLDEALQFKLFFGFVTFYTLLFIVAAFGIVWYGILMYFCFLALISISLSKGLEISGNHGYFKVGTLATCLAIVTLPYLGFTAPMRAWGNLPGKYDALEYKLGDVSENEAVFQSRPEYVTVLARLNLKDPLLLEKEIRAAATNPTVQTVFNQNPDLSFDDFVHLLDYTEELFASNGWASAPVSQEVRKLKKLLYERLIYPPKDNKNTSPIYRVGTFLTYYISENRSRFYEDSLITNFEPFLKGKDRDESVKNMEKVGLKYMILDLNAATIDRDPRHDLTRRFELLLDLTRSSHLKLIATDSLCLKLALEAKNDPAYMMIAGVNYNSYVKDEKGQEHEIPAGNKLRMCQQAIAKVIYDRKVSETSFSFLQPYSQSFLARNPKSAGDVENMLAPYLSQHSWMAAFELD